MSKKTRKKSSKPASRKPARAQTTRSAKTPPSKTRLTTATRSGKNISKQPRKTIAGASHKPASKTLKSPGRGASAVQVAAAVAKPVVATAAAKNAPEKKPPAVKAGPSAARNSVLTEGAKAPAFRLPRDGGDTVSLADYSGKKLVLFFYPRADTPGCTKEAIDFTRLASAFAETQTAVLGVSADPPKAQEAFRDKHELTTPLVSDEQHEVLEAYGVWGEKSMYGRIFHGILRTTVLIGADGRVIRIWRNVKVDGHADEVLAAVRAL
jgi:peroxiredoxin Q/BCP